MCRFPLITILVVSESINFLVLCKRPNLQDSDEENLEQAYLSRLFGTISRAKENGQSRRRQNNRNNDQIKYFYKTLSNTVDVEQYKNWLRQEAIGPEELTRTNGKDELTVLIEKELLNALSKKSSAVLDKPYIQKKGRNDYLVIQSDPADPFVTIVPNDIYYNAEKKCVNWLSDCNQRGLRNRLLQKVQGPFK